MQNSFTKLAAMLSFLTLFSFVSAAKSYPNAHTELFARDLAYSNHNLNEVVDCGVDGNFKVIKVFDHAATDGFYATAFQSEKEGYVLLACRGTQNWLSVIADTNSDGVGYKIYDTYMAEVATWAETITKDHKLRITGHSLGGALSQWFTVGLTHRAIPVELLETYNAPGISSPVIDILYNKDYCAAVRHHIQSGDIVSMAGWGYVPGENYIYYFFSYNLIYKHSAPMVLEEVNGYKRATDISHTTIKTTDLGLGDFCYSERSQENYYDKRYHAVIFVASQVVPLISCLHLRGTTEVVRTTAGFVVETLEWIVSWFTGVNDSVELEALSIKGDKILLNIKTDTDRDYDIYCCKRDDNKGTLVSVDSISFRAKMASVNEVSFSKLKPNTDYTFVIANFERDKEGRIIDLKDCNFLFITTPHPTGIAETTNPQTTMQVHRTSTDGVLLLERADGGASQPNQLLTVYDLNGAKVLSEVITEWPATLDLSHLAPGMYIVHADGQSIKVMR